MPPVERKPITVDPKDLVKVKLVAGKVRLPVFDASGKKIGNSNPKVGEIVTVTKKMILDAPRCFEKAVVRDARGIAAPEEAEEAPEEAEEAPEEATKAKAKGK